MNKRDTDIVLSSNAEFEALRDRTVLITGATGRLGRYIVGFLLELNRLRRMNIHIVGLARSKEKVGKIFPGAEDITWIYQDIEEEIRYSSGADYIFHMAGPASPSDHTYRPAETLLAHVKGTYQVLEFARRSETKKILYASTIEVYGDWENGDRIKESDMGVMRHTNARACYPESKRLCETMFACYRKEYGVNYVAVRMSHTFGPGIDLNDGRVFADFLKNVLKGEDIELKSDGSAMRAYTYVADAVGAMFLALLNGSEQYYNITNTRNVVSVRELAELVAGLDTSGKTKVLYPMRGENKGELQYLPFTLGVMDTGKIEALGWRPQVALREALQWTLESFGERESDSVC